MLEFRPIELGDKDVIESFTKPVKYMICEYSFVYFYIWKNVLNFEICVTEDALYIRGFKNGKYLYLLPVLKEWDRAVMDGYYIRIGKFANSQNQSWKLVCAEQVGMSAFTQDFSGKHLFKLNSEFSDYIYKADDLINLSGKKYHKKRNHISKFNLSYEYEFLPLTKEDFDECRSFYGEWKERKPDSMINEMAEEYDAINIAFDNFDKLGLIGACIKINGKIAGFTIGEYTNEHMATIHFEKCNPEFDGIYATINQMFVEKYFSNVIYINRQDDMGLEGLRKSKRSYYPYMMGEKHTIEKS